MPKAELLSESLKFARGFSSQLFDQFATAEEWVYQPHPNANHALWCMGHIARADNMVISIIAPEKSQDPEGHKELFGRGSVPTNDASKYPTASETRQFFDERRTTLLGLVAELSDDDLKKPVPDSAPSFLTDLESALRLIAFHEGLHAGQATVARQGLNKKPIVG